MAKGKDAQLSIKVDNKHIPIVPIDNGFISVNTDGALRVTIREAVEMLKAGQNILIEDLTKEERQLLLRALNDDGIERATKRLKDE